MPMPAFPVVSAHPAQTTSMPSTTRPPLDPHSASSLTSYLASVGSSLGEAQAMYAATLAIEQYLSNAAARSQSGVPRLSADFFRTVFPKLIEKAFGLAGAHEKAWLDADDTQVIRSLSALNTASHAVLRRLAVRRLVDLLSPDGLLLKAVTAADRDGVVLFNFPLSQLPSRTRDLLSRTVPAKQSTGSNTSSYSSSAVAPQAAAPTMSAAALAAARDALEALPHYAGTIRTDVSRQAAPTSTAGGMGTASTGGAAESTPTARVEVPLFSYFVFWFLVFCSRHGQGVMTPDSAATDAAGTPNADHHRAAAAAAPSASNAPPRGAVAGAPAPFYDGTDANAGMAGAGARAAAGSSMGGAPHASSGPVPAALLSDATIPTAQCAHPCRELLLRYVNYFASPERGSSSDARVGGSTRGAADGNASTSQSSQTPYDPETERGRHARIFFHAVADFLLSDSDEAMEWRVSLEGQTMAGTRTANAGGSPGTSPPTNAPILSFGAAVGGSAFGKERSPFDMPLDSLPSMPMEASSMSHRVSTNQPAAEVPRLGDIKLVPGAIDAATLVVRSLHSLHSAGASGASQRGVKDLLKSTEAVERGIMWFADQFTRLGNAGSPGAVDGGAALTDRADPASGARRRRGGGSGADDSARAGGPGKPHPAPKLPDRAVSPSPGVVESLLAFTRDERTMWDEEAAASKTALDAAATRRTPHSHYDAWGSSRATSTSSIPDAPWFVRVRRTPPLLSGAWPSRHASMPTRGALMHAAAPKGCAALTAKHWHPYAALYAPLHRFLMRTYQRWDASSGSSLSTVVELHLAVICPWDQYLEAHKDPTRATLSKMQAAERVNIGGGGGDASPAAASTSHATSPGLLGYGAQQLFGGAAGGGGGSGSGGSGRLRPLDFDSSGKWDSYVLLHAPFYTALRTIAEVTCRRCASSSAPERAARNLARVLAGFSMAPVRCLRLLKLEEAHAMAAHGRDPARGAEASRFLGGAATYVAPATKARDQALQPERCGELSHRLYAHWRLFDERRVAVMQYLAELNAGGTSRKSSSNDSSLDSLDVISTFSCLADEGGVMHLLRALNAYLKTDRAKGGEHLKRYADRLESWTAFFTLRLGLVGVSMDAAAAGQIQRNSATLSEPTSPIAGVDMGSVRQLAFSRHAVGRTNARASLHRPLSDREFAPLCHPLIRLSDSLNASLRLGEYATPALVGADQLNMWETLRTFLVKNNLSVDLRHLSEAQSLALMCALFVSLHVLGGRSLLRTIFTMVWMYVAGVLLVVISRRKTK